MYLALGLVSVLELALVSNMVLALASGLALASTSRLVSISGLVSDKACTSALAQRAAQHSFRLRHRTSHHRRKMI